MWFVTFILPASASSRQGGTHPQSGQPSLPPRSTGYAQLKLFFILFYLKTYPTFDVLGGLFDLSPAKAQENVVKLLPMLKHAEKNLRVLPHRHFKPAHDNPENTNKKRRSSLMPPKGLVAGPPTAVNRNIITVEKNANIL